LGAFQQHKLAPGPEQLPDIRQSPLKISSSVQDLCRSEEVVAAGSETLLDGIGFNVKFRVAYMPSQAANFSFAAWKNPDEISVKS
jgi:hypothetical protein